MSTSDKPTSDERTSDETKTGQTAPDASSRVQPRETRENRLAAALRANLRKRKSATRPKSQ